MNKTVHDPLGLREPGDSGKNVKHFKCTLQQAVINATQLSSAGTKAGDPGPRVRSWSHRELIPFAWRSPRSAKPWAHFMLNGDPQMRSAKLERDRVHPQFHRQNRGAGEKIGGGLKASENTQKCSFSVPFPCRRASIL